MVYPLGKLVLNIPNWIWVKEVGGRSNIPRDKGCIICPNHASFLDDIIVPTLIFNKIDKHVRCFVNRNYFNNIFMRSFLKWGRCIPVEVHQTRDKKRINEQAFKKAARLLKKGAMIGIFPEGHRTSDGNLQPPKLGAARLALAANVPIIPVGVKGTWRVLPKGAFFPKTWRKCVNVNYGKPIVPTGKNDKKTQQAIMDQVMKEIEHLRARGAA